MKNWSPRLDNDPGPLFMQLFRPLQQDIFTGTLKAGDSLPPQRRTASDLGLSLGTVSKAYQHAIQCGLVEAHVGRGTIVSGLQEPEQITDNGTLIDLQTNTPPFPLTRSLLLEASGRAARTLYRDSSMQYPPVAGLPRHRATISQWIKKRFNIPLAPDDITLTLGALQAISLAIAATSKVGQKIYGEPVTFAGIKSAAQYLGRDLCPLPMDEDGIIPEAFEQVARTRPGVTLITIPTVQNPTGLTYSARRRQALAAIAQKYDAWIIESDVYRFLNPTAPAPLHSHAPARTLYINSFSKCLSPDLRVGLLVAPEPLRAKIQQGQQAGGWSTPPLSVEIVCQLLQNGVADAYMTRLTQTCRDRATLVSRHLNDFRAPTSGSSYHLWMPCNFQTAEKMYIQARNQNVILTPPAAITLHPAPDTASGIRLCLGSEQRPQYFYFALLRLKKALTQDPSSACGII
ncbi:PLP-dependent aminotransferase family protein [Paremcibacter congregatus]|uniref:aminotransferase-like domain-containing protein n=1 Tax=Paremcibacter congregatus TaxID=2043170 RepID=UPI003A90E887